jgi:hypothetical protein
MVSSITEYKSYFEAGEDMTDEEYGQYMRAVHNFAYNDIEPDYSKLTPLVKAALRTVIASVRKNKEDRENGSKGGRPSRVSTEEKPRLLENKNPGLEKTETNENENVNENEKENVNTHNEKESACVPAYIPDPNKKINKELANQIFLRLQEHNKESQKDRRVPISNNFFNFSCKEMRELLSAVGALGAGSPENILEALENFLKVCKSDTWQKSHSWSTFCKHYADYTPEFFTLERYLNAEPETDDATQKPEYKFYMTMRLNARFHVETFQAHIEDWKREGRPEGEDYFRLQSEWEVA